MQNGGVYEGHLRFATDSMQYKESTAQIKCRNASPMHSEVALYASPKSRVGPYLFTTCNHFWVGCLSSM